MVGRLRDHVIRHQATRKMTWCRWPFKKRVGNSGGGSSADQRHESDWRWGVHSKTHINSCKFWQIGKNCLTCRTDASTACAHCIERAFWNRLGYYNAQINSARADEFVMWLMRPFDFIITLSSPPSKMI